MSGERQHYGLTLGVLTFAATAYALQQTMVVPALPELQRELGASTTWVTWVMTGFLLASAVLTPILGKLGDRFASVAGWTESTLPLVAGAGSSVPPPHAPSASRAPAAASARPAVLLRLTIRVFLSGIDLDRSAAVPTEQFRGWVGAG